MFKVIKNKGNILKAYRLGDDDPELEELITAGEIIPRGDGTYEVISREVIAGGEKTGELAHTGDYIKVDNLGHPYPNDAAYFAANHRPLGGNEYEQIPRVLDAWEVGEPDCEELRFLIGNKGLVINEADEERYFTAPLWGAVESAPKDAVIVFYSISRNDSGDITDASFNFVVRCEFDRTYSRL